MYSRKIDWIKLKKTLYITKFYIDIYKINNGVKFDSMPLFFSIKMFQCLN